MSEQKIIATLLLIFTSGFVSALNLLHLIPHNPDYEGAWWRFTLSVVIAVVSIIAVVRNSRRSD